MRFPLRPDRAPDRFAPLVLCLVCAAGCVFDPPVTTPPVEPPPDLGIADNLIKSIEIVYNDRVGNAAERLQDYAALFPPADDDSLSFIFHFQPVDVPPGEEPSWGLDGELEAHRNMFRHQESRDITSLSLDIQRLLPREPDLPRPGQEGWVEIFATNVTLRLMIDADNGFLVDGGKASFLLAPAAGRWFITEWTDLPRL